MIQGSFYLKGPINSASWAFVPFSRHRTKGEWPKEWREEVVAQILPTSGQTFGIQSRVTFGGKEVRMAIQSRAEPLFATFHHFSSLFPLNVTFRYIMSQSMRIPAN